MQSQKLDAKFNLAMELSPSERMQSEDLNDGYDSINETWELIVRYVGDISFLENRYGAKVIYLLANYAIVTIQQQYISDMISNDEIIYLEQPNPVFVQLDIAKQTSCIPSNGTFFDAFGGNSELTGEGVVVAVIDSGIDYAHPDFRNEDGTTRIAELWDQTGVVQTANTVDNPYQTGVIYTQAQINEALQKRTRGEQLALVGEVDNSGHGTFVAGVAAGNGRASKGNYRGVAPKAELVIVKLGNNKGFAYPRTIELMLALDYVIRYGLREKKPIAINLSFGNNYGAHNGQTLLESYISEVINLVQGNICIGMGNEGDTSRHTSIMLDTGMPTRIPFSVSPYQQSFSLQLWKNYVDTFVIGIIAPDNRVIGILDGTPGVYQFYYEDGNQATEVAVYYDQPKPYQLPQQIIFSFIGTDRGVAAGEWNLELLANKVVDGQVNLWLPVQSVVNPSTRFLQPTVEGSFTVPSTAFAAIAVGAYDSSNDVVAAFSGRGFTDARGVYQKPDLIAPGVNVTAPSPGGGYTVKSGTSIATPFVTGSVALLLEWGIVKGKDSCLYGEKMRAYLRKGARVLPGFSSVPNNQIGYGALCLRDSFW